MTDEREIKLSVPAGFTLPNLDGVAGLRQVDRGVRVLEATYWDTPGLDLLRAGHGLRHRTSDGADGRWTLKGGTHREGAQLVRDEVEIEGTPGQPPGELLASLAGEMGPIDLQPVASLRTRRHIVDLADDRGERWAEVADDRVAVLRDGDAVHDWREVEVEIVGPADQSREDAVLARLRAAGAGEPESSSKYAQALRALGYRLPEREPA
jgi:inorganic triphosphatase YgiF